MIKRERSFWIGLGLVALTALFAIAWWSLRLWGERVLHPLTFDDSSDELRETVIVPTLDAPIPNGKSAVWCASFQLAWNRLKDDVAGEPIRLAKAQEIADRLNRAGSSESDLEPDSVYAAAGFARDGIVKRIRSEMSARFPRVAAPELPVSPEGAVAYAYLAAAAKYEHPYFENDEPLLFRDSAGRENSVGSFGIRAKDDYAYHQLRDQVGVLYSDPESAGREGEVKEFVLDLSKTSQPYQVVVARVDRRSTLAETLEDIQRKVASHRPDWSMVLPRDTILVPNMAWRIGHRFRELEGRDRPFQNAALQGMHIDAAIQTIQFRLDRSGAELDSEAKTYVKPTASHFHVNRPFLVYMVRRDGQRPFFVAWIENAELLQKKPGQ
jgi:hypothetical protein